MRKWFERTLDSTTILASAQPKSKIDRFESRDYTSATECGSLNAGAPSTYSGLDQHPEASRERIAWWLRVRDLERQTRLEVSLREFLRFATVGLFSNALLFGLYLLLTDGGVGPRLAATLIYALGVFQTFVFNRSWSFRSDDAVGPAFGRYFAAYGFGYAINLLALFVLVDGAGLPHRWVQGFLILFLAAMLFLLQKFWVFRKSSGRK